MFKYVYKINTQKFDCYALVFQPRAFNAFKLFDFTSFPFVPTIIFTQLSSKHTLHYSPKRITPRYA